MATYSLKKAKIAERRQPVKLTKTGRVKPMPVDPYGFLVWAKGDQENRHHAYAGPKMRKRAEQLFIKSYPDRQEYRQAYGVGVDLGYYKGEGKPIGNPTPPDKWVDVGAMTRRSIIQSGLKEKTWAKAFELGLRDGALLKKSHLDYRKTGRFSPIKASRVIELGKTITADDSEEYELSANLISIFHVDGSPYFSAKAFDYAQDVSRAPKSRTTLVLMSPDDFLKMAFNIPMPSPEKMARVAQANGVFSDLPQLSFENNGDGTARVIGHEGRHRMYFLKAKGVRRVPILFMSQPGAGPAIRWGAATGYDAVDPWPTTLIGENNSKTIPFPVSEVYPRITNTASDFDMSHIKAGQSFEYMHNPKSSRGFKTNQYFGQDIEPAGRYLTYIAPKEEGRLPEGWQQGLLTFKKPLSVPWGSTGDYHHPNNWKQRLSKVFGGKTGKRLSQAVRNKGFDGIVTYDKYGPSEIVDLTMFTPKKRVITGSDYDYSEYGYWITDAGDLITVPQERHANVARNWIEKNNPRAVDRLRDKDGHLNATKAFDFVQTEWGWVRLQNHGLECNIAIVQNTVSRLAYKKLKSYLEESPFHIFVVDTSGDGYLHKTFIDPKPALDFIYKYTRRNLTALIEAAELEITATKLIKVYRGEYSGNKGGVFWTEDKEFARNFTQSGQDKEIRSRYLDPSVIDESAATTYAGDENGVTKALAHAKKNGFKAVRLNEGQNEPSSLYVFDKSALKLTASTDREQHYGKSLYDQGRTEYLVIYRAVPRSVIEFKPGDYVTLSKKFAIEHANHVAAMGDPAHVIKIIADPRKVYDAHNPGEYFYGGTVKRGKVFYIAENNLEASSELEITAAAKKRYFVRFGAFPKSGRSKLWNAPNAFHFSNVGKDLPGLSVYEVKKSNKKWEIMTDTINAGSGMASLSELLFRVAQDKKYPITLLTGIPLRWKDLSIKDSKLFEDYYPGKGAEKWDLEGTDGEPLLQDFTIVKQLKAMDLTNRTFNFPEDYDIEGETTMRADLLAGLQERMIAFHADGDSYTNKSKSVKAVFWSNRSTPSVVKPGKTVKAKAGYGKKTKVRALTPDELKQVKAGKWIRTREDGKKPNEKGSKKSSYRPWLHASIERRLQASGL